jgi:hypothetical protein
MSPIARLHFGQNPLHMSLDGLLADLKAQRDFLVSETSAYQLQDLNLSRRQHRVNGTGPNGVVDFTRQRGASSMNGTDDTKQLAKAGSIYDATHHACVQRKKRGVVGSASCDRDDPSRRTERANPADHVNPRHPAPAKVHQSDIGLMAKDAMNGVDRITCFANHREIGLSSDRSD